jgi:two-component sensor histidine kinase
MMPLRHEGGQLQGYLKVLRDRTEQRRAEEALRAAAAEKDLLVAEVHHRVRNSLQLVQNLLTLQARAAEDAATAAQLGESAGRVQTIAAIHEQLYRTGAALDVKVGPYLRGLIESMGQALASAADGRTIRLDADEATWPAQQATPLGLIAAELVTNALKYGQGAVTAAFRQPPGAAQAVLMVSDEGPGVPEDFDPAHSRGLGMRLVTGLLRGPGAGLEVVHGGPGACFVAHLPVPGARAED